MSDAPIALAFHAEVDDLGYGHAVKYRDEHILASREVAVDDAFLVCVLHAKADVDEERKLLGDREPDAHRSISVIGVPRTSLQ